MDLPTAANALTKSSSDKRPFLSQSMIPKASLNSWICLCENMAKMFEPLFLAFLVIRKLVIRCISKLSRFFIIYLRILNAIVFLIGIYHFFKYDCSSYAIDILHQFCKNVEIIILNFKSLIAQNNLRSTFIKYKECTFEISHAFTIHLFKIWIVKMCEL